MLKRDEASGPSCWTSALDDERVFVMLARDDAAPVAIRRWAEVRVAMGRNRQYDKQICDALECADKMSEERAGVRARLAGKPEAKVESGWLIETGSPAIWWVSPFGSVASRGCWTTDSTKATRFARKIDAETMIRAHRIGGAIATEHSWSDVALPPA